MKITLLIGLPGSGKSYTGLKMMESDEDINYLDDIDIMSYPIGYLMGCSHIVISDVNLCDPKYRDKAIRRIRRSAKFNGYVYKIERIYFENDLDKCLNNLRYRSERDNLDSQKIEALARDLFLKYKIPVTKPKQIWQPKEK